ncbi:MAG: calcium/sodium antiporter [Candidatus Aureabacteria bacterium]|nr:calcium/sodium antiporter [Candidatus Auribacterota bacterium]
MMPYLLLLAGFLLLIKGADLLVEGASSLARRLKVSDLAIGLTVVAFGTSVPELFVNIFASVTGNSQIAISNILGSNTFNILVILGVSALILPLAVDKSSVWKGIPLVLLAAILIGVLANDYFIDKGEYSALTRIDGIVLLLIFVVAMYYVAGVAKDINSVDEFAHLVSLSAWKSAGMIMLGLLGLVFGARWVVGGAVRIAESFNVSQSLIGATIIAGGTSFPELVTSIVAACKKNSEIAVGNIIGSNIFNVFFVLGVSSLIKPIPFQLKTNIDVSVCILSAFLLFIFMFTGRKHKLDRWEGAVFVLIYICYVCYIIIRK